MRTSAAPFSIAPFTIAAGLAALGGLVGPLEADVVRLRSGGEIRGKVDRETAGPTNPQVLVETLSGSIVTVDRADVDFVTYRSPGIEDYETRKRQVADTVEARWELAEWCRERNLRDQREEQLTRIVELDPNHEPAHRGLGHALRDGEWMSREDDMLARGYVKHKGEWVTPQQLELLEVTEADRARELEWFRQVRLWHGWLTGRNAERSRQGWGELQKISDPCAVPALQKFFSESDDVRLRSLYVEIVSRIPGGRAAVALARLALEDADHELRYAALNGISAEQSEAAMPLFIRELRSGANETVRRAALGLQRVGDEQSVPYLINALVTTHTYHVWVPQPGVTAGTGGTFGSGQPVLPPEVEVQLRTGQLPQGVIVHTPTAAPQPKRKMVVKRDHQNAEVLSALQRITGKNFGFDERTWKLWWNAEKSGATGNAPMLQ
ncbi:MAG TPA: hypothetical protein VML55_08975 [Planctomycetaceae bacterium]|nr:hypothetical protein [Planctomycetaceae bacterium]